MLGTFRKSPGVVVGGDLPKGKTDRWKWLLGCTQKRLNIYILQQATSTSEEPWEELWSPFRDWGKLRRQQDPIPTPQQVSIPT